MNEQRTTHELIALALAEDFGEHGDITADATIPEAAQFDACIAAQADGVVCGLEVATQVFRAVDTSIMCDLHVADGDRVSPGTILMQISGPARSVLKAERTALNFLGRLSGIATLTAQYVAQIEGTSVQLVDTRKTTPGWRALEKYAVTCGGGSNHRMGLYDRYLVKDNHIDAAGSIDAALAGIAATRRADCLFEVEVRNFEELAQVLQHNVDIIMLDNFTPTEVREAIAEIDGRARVEVSGGITLETIRNYAETGPDYISVGALTHSAVALPLHMIMR